MVDQVSRTDPCSLVWPHNGLTCFPEGWRPPRSSHIKLSAPCEERQLLPVYCQSFQQAPACIGTTMSIPWRSSSTMQRSFRCVVRCSGRFHHKDTMVIELEGSPRTSRDLSTGFCIAVVLCAESRDMRPTDASGSYKTFSSIFRGTFELLGCTNILLSPFPDYLLFSIRFYRGLLSSYRFDIWTQIDRQVRYILLSFFVSLCAPVDLF